MVSSTIRKPQIVFILGAGHSGSTLLDMAIGNHSQAFSLGEIVNLREELDKDETLCGCGKWLKNCAFWQVVFKDMANAYPGDWKKFGLQEAEAGRLSKLQRIMIMSGLLKAKHHPFIQNNLLLYTTVMAHSGKNVLVDSSKNLGRSLLLGKALKDEFEVHYIHLVRRAEAQINSTRKSHYSAVLPDGSRAEFKRTDSHDDIEKPLKAWVTLNQRHSKVLPIAVAKNRLHVVAYEDFVASPETGLKAICDRLDLAFEPGMLQLQGEKHTIAGNSSRVNARAIETKKDVDLSQLSGQEIEYIQNATASLYNELNRRSIFN